jgi:hypothetical protein
MGFPYRHANGNICCSNPDHPCEACSRRLVAEGLTPRWMPQDFERGGRLHWTRGLRSLASTPDNYAPPDPYAAGLAALRNEAAARTQQPPPRPTPLDANGVPDPYAAGLAAMKENRR